MTSIDHRWEIFAFEYFSKKKKRVLKDDGCHHHKLFNFFSWPSCEDCYKLAIHCKNT